jgi:hypothetical protein
VGQLLNLDSDDDEDDEDDLHGAHHAHGTNGMLPIRTNIPIQTTTYIIDPNMGVMEWLDAQHGAG